MSKKGVSNYFLIKKLLFVKGFKGVFSRNELHDKKLFDNEFLIINLALNTQPGTHLVAIANKKNKLYYFDSLSLYLPYAEIEIFLKKHQMKIYKLKFPLQSHRSTKCGYFCLVFLRCIYRMSFNKFTANFFKKNLDLNDHLVLSFCNKVYF